VVDKMSITQNPEAELMEKIRSLPPDKITVLKDFIDFLLTRSEAAVLVDTATKLSEATFAKIWNNPEDAEYAEQLEESAALYAEIYEEDTDLQELTELGLEEWLKL
jgi:hypothetical protein